MYNWSIQTKVEECQGIMINHKHTYSILVRLDNNFSQQSTPAKIIRNKLQFKTSIQLEFNSNTSQLPSNHLQILLIKNQTNKSQAHHNNSDSYLNNGQQIIGIASLKINYPLSQQLQKVNTYNFDRSFQKKSTIKISLTIKRQYIKGQDNNQSDEQITEAKDKPWLSLLQLQIQKNKQYQKHLSTIFQQLNKSNASSNGKNIRKTNENKSQLQRERDELYKLSESLYKQLKDCTEQRDEFLRQLRERQLSYDQLKQQFEFLKIKIDQYEQNIENNQLLLSELEFYKNQSKMLNINLENKEREAIEMQRKIKQSLIAVQNFRKEASQARNELINKQFEQSSISRGSKYLDPVQILQQLSYEIRTRKLQQVYILQPLKCNKMQLDNFYKVLEKEIIILFTQLMNKMPTQKMFLIKKKSQFLHKVQELTIINSLQG